MTDSVDEYADAVMEFLHRDPVRCSVPLTVIVSAQAVPMVGSAYSWVSDGPDVVGTASVTPPHSLLLSPMDDDVARVVAEAWAGPAPVQPHGLVGPRAVASACAGWLEEHAGWRLTEDFPERLFQLDAVTPPRQPPGRPRMAAAEDLPLVLGWLAAFADEAGVVHNPHPERMVAAQVEDGRLWLWEDAGAAVSMTGMARSVAGVTRVAPVYTPTERRGNGYARALVAAVSQARLDAGDTACCLFTDLTNPVSNTIYQQIGYRPVEDFAQYVRVAG